MANDFSDQLLHLFLQTPLRITCANPVCNRSSTLERPYTKIIYRLEKFGYAAEKRTETQDFHAHLKPEEVQAELAAFFPASFTTLDAQTETHTFSWRRAKSGRILYTRSPQRAASPPAAHNRKKQYLIPEGTPVPLLTELGIFTPSGKVRSEMYDKYKQINRFLEWIDDVVRKDDRPLWRILDYGCGKSYLTFLVYHYLTEIRGLRAVITGLDLKEDVITHCNALAQQYGMDSLRFVCADVDTYTPEEKPDMLISLHLCDTATDHALAQAVTLGAEYIFAVPCCQKEVNAAAALPELPLFKRYGLMKERFSALATDVLRARVLESCGYRVDTLEFIDLAHSPKNILIRARRIAAPSAHAMDAARLEAEQFCTLLGMRPAVVRYLMDHTEVSGCL